MMDKQASSVPINADPKILLLLRNTESDNNKWAVRFERKVFNRITNQQFLGQELRNIISAHHCSADTARVIYSTSFGATQIMGFNLYGFIGYKGTIGEYLADDSMQDFATESFLVHNKINFTLSEIKLDPKKRDQFALAYNGSLDYVARMNAIIKRLGL